MAMARPNTTAIKKHKMVDQFQQLGLKSIINLQTPGTIYISLMADFHQDINRGFVFIIRNETFP